MRLGREEMGKHTSFPDDEHGQNARGDEEEERDEDEAGAQRVLALQDAVLGDQEQDGAEATGDAGRNGPGGEDLRDALPAPNDAVAAERGDAGPDDAAYDGMSRRMGRADVSERSRGDPSRRSAIGPLSSSARAAPASSPRLALPRLALPRLPGNAEGTDRRRRKDLTYVVDTGRPTRVAMLSQVEEPTKAHTMVNINTAGSCSK